MKTGLLISRRSAKPRRFSIVPPSAPYVAQITASAQDATENTYSNTVTIDDPVLFLGYDGVLGQTFGTTMVGLRWPNVTLEQAAPVPFAQIRFKASNGNGQPVVLRIWCEDGDEPAAFSTTAANLSTRAKTTAFVDWEVPAWEPDQDNADTRSPNLASIIQEVVDRPGWAGTLVFLIETSPANVDTTAPRRRAVAYDLDPGGAAILYVNTSETVGGGEPPPAAIGDFSDGFANGDVFGLVGNESFNSASPTWKDGTAIAGDALTYWTAATHAMLNATNTTTNPERYVNLGLWLANQSTYNSSRFGQTIQLSNVSLFAMDGDLRKLDALMDDWEAAKTPERISWNGHDCATINARPRLECPVSSGDPWSPYPKWVDLQSGWSQGTDLQYQNTNKHFSMLVEFVWALYVNRTKTSPAHGAGAYQTAFDYWKVRVEGFVKTWSEEGSAPWRINYWGDEFQKTRRRAPWGVYPLVFRNGGHPALQAAPTHHYLGLLGLHAGLDIPNPSDALAWTATLLGAIRENMPACTGTWGANLLVRGRMVADGTGETTPHGSTYSKYTAQMFVRLWQIGRYRSILTREDMRRIALAWADMHRANGTTWPDILGDLDGASGKCGLVRTASGEVDRTNQAWGATASMLVFEDRSTTTRLRDVAIDVQTNVAGGLSTPWSGKLAAALAVREALDAAGDIE